MVKQYPKHRGPYFYHEQFLAPYGQDPKFQMFVVIGTKNTGKTTSFLKWAIAEAKAHVHEGTHRFGLVLRRKQEVETYWDAFTNKGEGGAGCRIAKDYVVEGEAEDGEWYPIARIMSLGGSGAGRSKQHGGYSTVIVDDAVPIPGEMLIPNIANKLIIIMNNLGRENFSTMRLIITANNNRQDAEIYGEFGFQPKDGGGIQLVDNGRGMSKTVVYTEGFRSKEGGIAPQHKDTQGIMMCFPPKVRRYLTQGAPFFYHNDYINQNLIREYRLEFTFVVLQRPFEFGQFMLKGKRAYLIFPVEDEVDLTRPVIAFDDVSINSIPHAKMRNDVNSFGVRIGKASNQGLVYYFYLGDKPDIMAAVRRHAPMDQIFDKNAG